MSRFSLVPAIHKDSFSIDMLNAQKLMRVVKIVSENKYLTVVEIEPSDLINPADDPLIVGTIVDISERQPIYSTWAVWRNKLWRLMERDTVDLLRSLNGVQAGDPAEFISKLKAEIDNEHRQ